MPQTAEVELARRLKAARALSGKKTRELASELGWSEAKVYRLERGDQVPDAIELAAIANATGQPLEFFFGASLSEDEAADGGANLPHPFGSVKPDNGDGDEQ